MRDILTSLRLIVLTLAVCCILYPLALLIFGRTFAPGRAEGSLLRNAEGVVIGSSQIAQKFTRPEYFWPRPSAVDYNAAATGGSNLSPANPAITERAEGIIAMHDLASGELIPAELVTASGSGLDPHISRSAARFQAPRVAHARGIPPELVDALIGENEEVPMLKIFGGEPVVNVLRLNLALDAATAPVQHGAIAAP